MVSLIKKIKDKRVWLSFIVALILLYLLFSKLELKSFISVISKANIPIFLFALIVYFLVFPILALRWSLLLRNIKLKINFFDLNSFIFLQWFANSILPAKLGDLYKGYLIKKHYKYSMSKIIGTVFVERLFDLIFIAFFSLFSALLVFKGFFPEFVAIPILVLFLLIITVIILLFFVKNKKDKIIKILPEKIKVLFKNFEHGISKSVKTKDILMICIYSFLSLTIQVFVTYLISIAIGLNISLPQAAFVTMVSALITIIPITPAGVGVGEITVAAIFIMLNIEKNMAISAAILIRATYWLLLVFGGIFYFVTSKK